MSYIFSRALVEEFSQVNCSGIDAFAPLNLIPTPKPSSLPGRTMEHFRRSRFGMMFGLSTDDLGAELLTSWQEAFHARTSQPQDAGTGLTASAAGSGRKWLGSLARFDRATSSWRTAQRSLLGGWSEYSETWPRWGSMRNGECWERMTAVPHTSEKESGLWPTPTVCGNYNRKGASKTSGDGLATAVKKWPTPQASDNRDRGNMSTPAIARRIAKGKQVMLSMSVSASNGRLNPDWVEWLMGWPIGHTDLKPLATGKLAEWRQQHGESFGSQGLR